MLRAVVPVLALAGCVAAAPDSAAPPMVGLSSAPVTVDGQAFMVAMGPASFGRVPGQAGIAMVAGRSATVSRGDGGPLAPSDGLVAKRAVTTACADSGGRLNDRALGRYAGGAWVFDGVCG